MKVVHIFLEDAEYDLVIINKGKKTWKEFVMGL